MATGRTRLGWSYGSSSWKRFDRPRFGPCQDAESPLYVELLCTFACFWTAVEVTDTSQTLPDLGEKPGEHAKGGLLLSLHVFQC